MVYVLLSSLSLYRWHRQVKWPRWHSGWPNGDAYSGFLDATPVHTLGHHTHNCTSTFATRALKCLNGLYGFGKLQFLFCFIFIKVKASPDVVYTKKRYFWHWVLSVFVNVTQKISERYNVSLGKAACHFLHMY